MNYKEEVLKVYPDAVYVHFPESVYFKHHIRLYTEETIKSIGVSNNSEEEAWNTAYLDLPVKPTTITVTGCGDCPMKGYDSEYAEYSCNHPDRDNEPYHPSERSEETIFSTCPLKTSPITIMLKK